MRATMKGVQCKTFLMSSTSLVGLELWR